MVGPKENGKQTEIVVKDMRINTHTDEESGENNTVNIKPEDGNQRCKEMLQGK